MSLSTSSSEAAAPGTRRLYLRILITILIGMGLAMGIIRVANLINDASSQSFLGRVLQSQAALPRILSQDEDLMMFYGSSTVQAGFSPRQFGKEMAERGVALKAYNFGFGGLNPYYQEFLSRRIVEAFGNENRRLKLLLIEFNPFQTTVTRRNRALALEDSFLSLLASPGELREIALQDPTRGIRLYNIRYLRDSISAEMITNHFASSFRPPQPHTELEKDEAREARLGELSSLLQQRFQEEYPDYDGSDWTWAWQGGGTIPEERSAETLRIIKEYYEYAQSDYRMDDDRLWRIHSADIEDLNFDEVLIESFIQLVRNFESIADHVEIVLLPKNSKWIRNPPGAVARLNAVLERIETETGVRVRNFQDAEAVTPDMFSDTTHLNRYQGAVTFTRLLVEAYAPPLAD